MGRVAYDQIAAHLAEPPGAVQRALADLRAHGLIEALSHGRPAGHVITAADYWKLTNEGRSELARLRGDGDPR
jgi:DNA-binding PadR family transcriptional regulator